MFEILHPALMCTKKSKSKQANKQNRNTTPALDSHGEEKRRVVPKWLSGAGIPLPSSKCYQELFGRFPWWKVTRCHMFLFPIWPHSLYLLFLFFLTILFLRDKNLEKTISVGVRAAEPTLRSSGSVKFRAYFLGWCHCSSAKERGASLTGLEMKETKNIQPSYVWGTMPALNNLKCRLRAEGHLSTVRTSAQVPTGHVTGRTWLPVSPVSFLSIVHLLALCK